MLLGTDDLTGGPSTPINFLMRIGDQKNFDSVAGTYTIGGQRSTGTGAGGNLILGTTTTSGVSSAAVNALINRLFILGGQAATQVGIGGSPVASAVLDLQSTVGALLVPRMTTAQKTALTAVNGMILYDTDLGKFQGYEAGAWINLI